MREKWGSIAGFLLATIGAAVGLGNVWRFAYIAGAVFLAVYLLFVALIGLPLVIAELSMGRRASGDAVTAFHTLVPGVFGATRAGSTSSVVSSF